MKFSIVVPSFRQAEYLPRTLDSILSQEGDFEIECLVEDGGSPDDSAEILADYARRTEVGEYPVRCRKISFSYVSEPDRGQTHAINKWLAKATGDILAYCNSDDTYAPGAFARVAELFARCPETAWCHGRCVIIDADDRPVRGFITAVKNVLIPFAGARTLLVLNPVSQMTVFWSRAAWGRVGEFRESESLCMDYEYWLRLSKIADPVYIPHHLANFRTYPSTKSSTRFVEQFRREYELARESAAGGHPWLIALHRLSSESIILAYRLLHRLDI